MVATEATTRNGQIAALGQALDLACQDAAELRAKVDALALIADCRLKHCLDFRDRIEKLERDRKRCLYAIAALIVAVGLTAVSR